MAANNKHQPDETNIVPFPNLDLAALDFAPALESLWHMLQNEDGSPMSIDANTLMTALHSRYTELENAQRRLAVQMEAITEVAKDLEFQRDHALGNLESFRRNAFQTIRRQIAADIRIEFDLKDNAEAEAVLNAITGFDDAVSRFQMREMRDLIAEIVQELRDNGDL